jgi:hypothetical protein
MIDLSTLVPSIQDARVDSFDELSRYRGLPLLTCIDRNGRQVVYVERRFIPQPETMAEVGSVEVREGDRLDNIAAVQLADARWWWRIADANRALNPADLTSADALGRKLRITLPQGVPLPQPE